MSTGNPVLDRIAVLESMVFGYSGPRPSKITVLTGSADQLVKYGINLVASTVRNNMRIAAPLAGPPGVGQDGEVMTIYSVSPAGNFHTITCSPPGVMHAAVGDLFQTNPAPFFGVALDGLGAWVSFLAYNGQLIVVDGFGSGLLTLYSWPASTALFVGYSIMDSNGNIQNVTAVAGDAKAGSSAPTWSTTLNGTTVDHNVTWTLVGIPT